MSFCCASAPIFIEAQKLIVSLPEVEFLKKLFEVLGIEDYNQGCKLYWFLFELKFILFCKSEFSNLIFLSSGDENISLLFNLIAFFL